MTQPSNVQRTANPSGDRANVMTYDARGRGVPEGGVELWVAGGWGGGETLGERECEE